jgi:hypothetical protein
MTIGEPEPGNVTSGRDGWFMPEGEGQWCRAWKVNQVIYPQFEAKAAQNGGGADQGSDVARLPPSWVLRRAH